MSAFTLYPTTRFNTYPPNQRHTIMTSRERIINLRLHAQKIGIHNQELADHYWNLSIQEEKKLEKWLETNPPTPLQKPEFLKACKNRLLKMIHILTDNHKIHLE